MALFYNISYKNNPDSLGALASGLCLIHCIITPFLFIAQTCSATCCDTAPSWWSFIDYLFIGISFFAVYWSTTNSSKKWVIYALWTSWVGLAFIILNEKIKFYELPESIIYLPALALIVLHLYNQKYCQCKDENCCSSTTNT